MTPASCTAHAFIAETCLNGSLWCKLVNRDSHFLLRQVFLGSGFINKRKGSKAGIIKQLKKKNIAVFHVTDFHGMRFHCVELIHSSKRVRDVCVALKEQI